MPQIGEYPPYSVVCECPHCEGTEIATAEDTEAYIEYIKQASKSFTIKDILDYMPVKCPHCVGGQLVEWHE